MSMAGETQMRHQYCYTERKRILLMVCHESAAGTSRVRVSFSPDRVAVPEFGKIERCCLEASRFAASRFQGGREGNCKDKHGRKTRKAGKA